MLPRHYIRQFFHSACYHVIASLSAANHRADYVLRFVCVSV